MCPKKLKYGTSVIWKFVFGTAKIKISKKRLNLQKFTYVYWTDSAFEG